MGSTSLRLNVTSHNRPLPARAALEAAIEALEEPVELEATDFVLHGGYDPRQYVFHTRPVKEPVKVATIDKSALRRAFGLEETE